MIKLYQNKEEFDKRADKSINGITQDWLTHYHAEAEDIDMINCKGCFNCHRIENCINCSYCVYCKDLEDEAELMDIEGVI